MLLRHRNLLLVAAVDCPLPLHAQLAIWRPAGAQPGFWLCAAHLAAALLCIRAPMQTSRCSRWLGSAGCRPPWQLSQA